MIFDFLLGAIFGSTLITVTYRIIEVRNKYNRIIKPIYKFLEIPINEIKFESRKGHLVTLLYDKYIIYLSLDKGEIYISEKGEILYVTDKLNEVECNYLYNKLYKSFDTEINVNVVEYNGITLSNNILIPKEKNVVDIEIDNYVPELDDILDKISQHGMDSLTQVEIDILKEVSGD